MKTVKLLYQEAEVVDPNPFVISVDAAFPWSLMNLLHCTDSDV